MNIIETMRQAREALDEYYEHTGWESAAADNLSAVIEQMEKAEPAAWLVYFNAKLGGVFVTDKVLIWCKDDAKNHVREELIQKIVPLYTHPAPALPEDWQPVPKEPTDKMKDAYQRAVVEADSRGFMRAVAPGTES